MRLTLSLLLALLLPTFAGAQSMRADRKSLPLRDAVAAYHAHNYDATLNSGAGGLRNIGRSQGGAAAMLFPATAAARPTRLTYANTPYVRLPGAASNAVSLPQTVGSALRDDFRIELRYNKTTASSAIALGFWRTAVGQRSFYIYDQSSGVLQFGGSIDGSIGFTANATAAIATSGARWIAVTRNATTGAVGFEETADGVTWAAIGTSVSSTAGTLSDSVELLYVGAYRNAAELPMDGTFFAVRAWTTTTATGTPLIDLANSGIAQNAWTNTGTAGGSATILRSTTGLKTVVMDGKQRSTLLLDGSDDRASVADHDLLDFSASQSATISLLYRRFGNASGNIYMISKKVDTGTGSGGWLIRVSNAGLTPLASFGDVGAISSDASAGAVTDGARSLVGGIRDVPADRIKAVVNSTISAGTLDTTTGTLASTNDLLLGALNSASPTAFANGEYTGFGVWRTTKTATQLKQTKFALESYGAAARN